MKYFGTFRGQFEFKCSRYSEEDIICEIEDFLNERGFEIKMLDVNEEPEPYEDMA